MKKFHETFGTRCVPYLPTEEELKTEIERQKEIFAVTNNSGNKK